MDRSLLKKIIDFIRIDGPLDAPFCFLTIEDGGGFEGRVVNNIKMFTKVFQENSHWVPEKGELTEKINNRGGIRGNLGKPGLYISKIMNYILHQEIEGYVNYIENSLYINNEMNIKFLPISRNSTNQYDNVIKSIENHLGVKISEYEDLSRNIRIKKFINRKDLFNKNKFYIITGYKNEWMEILKQVYPDIDYFSTITQTNSKNKINFQIYKNANGSAKFAYFNFFRLGISDDDISSFADAIIQNEPRQIKQLSD